MAGGGGRDVRELECGAECVWIWRGKQKICGGDRFADGPRAAAGIRSELFERARRIDEAGRDGEGTRDKNCCDCGIDSRAGGSGGDVQEIDLVVRGAAEGIGLLLRGVFEKDGECGAAGRATARSI